MSYKGYIHIYFLQTFISYQISFKTLTQNTPHKLPFERKGNMFSLKPLCKTVKNGRRRTPVKSGNTSLNNYRNTDVKRHKRNKLCLCCVNNAVEVFIKTELCKSFRSKRLITSRIFVFPIDSSFLLTLTAPRTPVGSALVTIKALSAGAAAVSKPEPIPAGSR